MHVPEGGNRAVGIKAEMQRDHAHETFGENAAGKLFVPAGLQGRYVTHRNLRHRRELFPAHVA
jgi:hypothetical protein